MSPRLLSFLNSRDKMLDPVRKQSQNSFSFLVFAGLCVALGLTLSLSAFAPQSVLAQNTYTVDVTGDNGDADPGDGECETTSGNCTLRAAIEEANASSSEDIIEFGAIAPEGGPAQITPSSQLTVTETVTIDGTTEDSYTGDAPTVLIDGGSLPDSDDDGLFFQASANRSNINALAVVDAPDDGIDVDSETSIRNCYVGVSTDGTTSNGNGDNGILLLGDENTVGSNNVIGGNDAAGIRIQGGNNDVFDNLIGLGAGGTTDVGNGGAGILIDEGSSNLIGDSSTDPTIGNLGNTISGNSGAGIRIESDGNVVLSNAIGTTPDGSTAQPNSSGVVLLGNNNTVGGSNVLATNVISGNDFNGIRIGEGGETSASDNTVENNVIGTDASGTSAVPNGNGSVEGGVRIDEGTDNEILDNVISGNTANGILIRGASPSNTIQGNRIGVDANDSPLGNEHWGIVVETNSNTIGGLDSEDGNRIGDNANAGIRVEGNNNSVHNNEVGVTEDGADVGNGANGLFVSGDSNVLGTVSSDSSHGNLVGNNSGSGIYIQDGSNNALVSNHIGTTPTGDSAPNGDHGINIEATSDNASTENVIGFAYGVSIPSDVDVDDGLNVIANNGGDGVFISGAGDATGNSVRGNRIYDNAEIPIDLAGGDEDSDGKTSNDNGDDDADTGPNNLQNFPEINDVSYDEQNDEVTIDYTVFTSSNHANYGSNGLAIDFYAGTDSQPDSRTYLDTQFYNSPSSAKQVVIALPSGVSPEDYFVATATDADGNTSEHFQEAQPLPVELAAFEAQNDGEAVQLSWKTASETENAGFDVERRTEGEDEWTKVDFVEGQGTTSEPQTYSLRDQAFSYDADSLFYRLKQIDTDGSVHLSDEVTVHRAVTEVQLLGTYPNPARSQATVRYAVPDRQTVTLFLYDVLGRKLRTVTKEKKEGRTKVQLDVSGLSSGTYFLQLETRNMVKTERLTVVR